MVSNSVAGLNVRRCCGEYPNRATAARWSAVAYPLCRSNPYLGSASCSSCINRSRVTFATIDAAAMAAERRSPPITPRWAIGNDGIRKASTKTASGRGARAKTARRIACRVAWWMLIRSISSGSIAITAHAVHLAQISSCNRSRAAAVSAFESARPSMRRSGSRITAPAITGPARHPRPTSSTPATHTKP